LTNSGDKVITIGKITGAHGIRGAVKAFFYSGTNSNFAPDGMVRIRRPKGSIETFALDWSRPAKRHMVLGLARITTRNQAETLAGSEVVVDRRHLPPPEADSYYWTDLIGMAVHTVEGADIGRIESIIPTGSHDVYVVRSGKQETLIPAVASMIREIDLETKTMRVDLPEGL
jgi:16S rRNA processing protein RimM